MMLQGNKWQLNGDLWSILFPLLHSNNVEDDSVDRDTYVWKKEKH